MRNILITGGAGFIGSHLCRRLLEQGDEVYCLDIFYSSARRNIADLESDPHFHWNSQMHSQGAAYPSDEF